MKKLTNAARQALFRSAVVVVPLVVASACSESGRDSFFSAPMGGRGSVSTGGKAGSPTTGGSSGSSTGGTANATSGGANAGGSAGDNGAGTGGNATAGGSAGMGGSAGDSPIAGTGGSTDPMGGTGGMEPGSGGEGGMAEGGMGTTGGTAGATGGSAGSTGGDAGSNAIGGSAGVGGVAGAAGVGGVAGTAGTGGCEPHDEICEGTDNDCGDDIDEGGVCPSGCQGGTFEGETYLLCVAEDTLDWDVALEFCQDLSSEPAPIAVAGPMTLVEIDSAEENGFLADWLVSEGITQSVWMGANDLEDEGRWHWDRGSDAALPFLTVVNFNRTIIEGRYNDFPSGIFQDGVSGDCGILAGSDDFHWDDRTCTSGLARFICGEIP